MIWYAVEWRNAGAPDWRRDTRLHESEEQARAYGEKLLAHSERRIVEVRLDGSAR